MPVFDRSLPLLCLALLSIMACNQPATEPDPGFMNLPPGFEWSIYAGNVPNARGMCLGSQGTLFVGSRSAGKVYAVLDTDHDFKADTVLVLAEGINMPAGVAFKNGDLYYSAVTSIYKLPDIEQHLYDPPAPVLVTDQFPNQDGHGWKYIAFGPDGKLYVPVGAPCNICNKPEPIYASITRMNDDGSDLEIIAHGIRNTVGFCWQPGTNDLWFTDNGRDWLGDDLPPGELNHLDSIGQHFGYPFCHGDTISDPEFGSLYPCSDFTPPAQKLGPHVAPLGLKFYTGNMFPEEYRNQIFIAEHGSWNRSTKIGYRVTLVKLENNKPVSYEVFADGWQVGEDVSGRPVDILILPDGSMLVSDDFGNKIYRITYKG